MFGSRLPGCPGRTVSRLWVPATDVGKEPSHPWLGRKRYFKATVLHFSVDGESYHLYLRLSP